MTQETASKTKSLTSQTYHWVEATIPISLSPVYQQSIRKGIEDFLQRLLHQFIKEFNGVFLFFKNLKLISNLSEIKNESPYIRVNVSFGAWVFCPSPDAIIDGVVTKVSPGHVGLLVDGLFNANIAASSQLIPFGWVYNSQDHFWDGNTGSEKLGEIREGTVVRFRINRVDKSKNMINISGSFIPKNGELLGALETSSLPPTIIVDPSTLDNENTNYEFDHIDFDKGIVDPFADDDDDNTKKESNANHIVFQNEEDGIVLDNAEQESAKSDSTMRKSISNKISFSSPIKSAVSEKHQSAVKDVKTEDDTAKPKTSRKKSKKQEELTENNSSFGKKRKGAEDFDDAKESTVIKHKDDITNQKQDEAVSHAPKRSSTKKEKKAKKSKVN